MVCDFSSYDLRSLALALSTSLHHFCFQHSKSAENCWLELVEDSGNELLLFVAAEIQISGKELFDGEDSPLKL